MASACSAPDSAAWFHNMSLVLSVSVFYPTIIDQIWTMKKATALMSVISWKNFVKYPYIKHAILPHTMSISLKIRLKLTILDIIWSLYLCILESQHELITMETFLRPITTKIYGHWFQIFSIFNDAYRTKEDI